MEQSVDLLNRTDALEIKEKLERKISKFRIYHYKKNAR